MSERFEDEVRSALRSGVTDELSAVGLADGARSRLRRRRRTTMSIVGAAVLVAAVPVGIAALNTGPNGSGNGPIAEALDQPAVEGLPAGWHWESYANVEFGVPNSWKHGSPNQWCVGGGGLDQAWVSRPNEAQTLVACMDPTNGYGAVILDVSATDLKSGVWQYPANGHEYPAGAWMTSMVAGDLGVSVAAPDKATAEAIADSFRAFEGTDANGCASQQDIPQFGAATGLSSPDSGPVVLCTYSGTTPGANLAGSEPLSADRAQALLDALATAKDDGAGMGMPECASLDPDGVLILRGGQPLGWAFNTGCSDSGVYLGNGETLPPTAKLIEAIYGYAPADPAGSGDGGVVVENPDGSVSNDGTVVPPDQGSGGSSTGGGSSGSSGSEPGSIGGAEGSTGPK